MPSPIPGDNGTFQGFRTADDDVPDDAGIGDFRAWAEAALSVVSESDR